MAFLPGCSGGTDVGNPEAASFSSDHELTKYLLDQYASIAQPVSLWSLDNDAQPGWIDSEVYSGERGYVETDAMVEDADESDLVKTDGEFLYRR